MLFLFIYTFFLIILKVLSSLMTTTEHNLNLIATFDMKRRSKLVYVMSKVILNMTNYVRSQMPFIG